jgi:secreted trypsin-like serine protease
MALLFLTWQIADQPAAVDHVVAIVDERVPGATLIPGYRCAGVVLSPSEVLTAAHCVDDMPVDALRVVVGGPDLCADPSGLALLEVDGVQIADSYEVPGWAFDIAVLTLGGALSRAPLVVIGPRPTSGSRVMAYGWAGDALSQVTSCRPRSVELDVLADSDCTARLGEAAAHYDPSVAFCAVGVDANTCQGDSGGPVFSTTPNNVVGIVSWGVGCQVRDVGVYALPVVPN